MVEFATFWTGRSIGSPGAPSRRRETSASRCDAGWSGKGCGQRLLRRCIAGGKTRRSLKLHPIQRRDSLLEKVSHGIEKNASLLLETQRRCCRMGCALQAHQSLMIEAGKRLRESRS